MVSTRDAYSERDFYLQEFRGRTLGIACPAGWLRDPSPLASVVQTLARNETRVVVISTRRQALTRVVGDRILPAATPRLETAVWRAHASVAAGMLLGAADRSRSNVARSRCPRRFSGLISSAGGLRAPGGCERLSSCTRRSCASCCAGDAWAGDWRCCARSTAC